MPLLYRFADAAGTLAGIVDGGRARASRQNLQELAHLGSDRRRARALTRQSYRHMSTYLGEFLAAPGYPNTALADKVRLTGQEHLAAAHRHGKGILLLSAHYSNWELCAASVAYLGYPMALVAQLHPDAITNELFLRPRVHCGLETVDVFTAVRPAYRRLRENGVVALMADRDITGTGVTVTFFGRPVRFPKGPARLSLGSGAPAVFTFLRRRADRSYDQKFLPPVYPEPSGDRDRDVLRLTQRYADIIARQVAEDPTQYTVFFPIWEGFPPVRAA